ncbi:hypothetical protein L2E82_30865 [Cichorium intybus]|uniref:Uncharacterized protein n=1 Tax=Cichorium intybus TaxID=13427 RepID=A0ACB9D1T6_CICIN|nr:hypothetical protein L2E82_30865 [Cichorium intybus]
MKARQSSSNKNILCYRFLTLTSFLPLTSPYTLSVTYGTCPSAQKQIIASLSTPFQPQSTARRQFLVGGKLSSFTQISPGGPTWQREKRPTVVSWINARTSVVCACPFSVPDYIPINFETAKITKRRGGNLRDDQCDSSEIQELTKSLANAWYAGQDKSFPVEIDDLCEGIYGTGGGGS